MAISELGNSIPVMDLCTGEEEECATYDKHCIANLTQAWEMRCAKETVELTNLQPKQKQVHYKHYYHQRVIMNQEHLKQTSDTKLLSHYMNQVMKVLICSIETMELL